MNVFSTALYRSGEDMRGLLWCVSLLAAMSYSSATDCVTGWFGEHCKYKCRCDNNKCDNHGECVETSTCAEGWFGPACQYADMAFTAGHVKELTDGNDKTCVTASSLTSLSIPLNASTIITWLRVVVSKPESTSQIEVTFISNSTSTDCSNKTYSVVDSMTTNIHCDLNDPVEQVVLSGQGVQHLCSLYVSGGWNLALKEKTDQSSTYNEQSAATYQLNISYTSNKAVDGKISQRLHGGFSCAVTQMSPTKREFWEITFSSPRSVTRYLIYGRNDTQNADDRLCNFTLESYDEADNVVYGYTDELTGELQDTVTLIHTARAVAKVNIHSNFFPRQLTLCEVEIFGESICEGGKYGPNCEHTCSCPNNATCVVSSGGCPFLSVPSLVVPTNTSNTSCAPNVFGANCSLQCSAFCVKNSVGVNACTGPDGACDEGCLNGYLEPTCTERCPKDTYGKDCKHVCGPNCLAAKSPNASACHHASGVCLLGCVTGTMGPLCDSIIQKSVRAPVGGSESHMGLLIGLLAAVLIFLPFVYCLRKRKQTRPPHVEEKGRH